jgi:hypothetical protein
MKAWGLIHKSQHECESSYIITEQWWQVSRRVANAGLELTLPAFRYAAYGVFPAIKIKRSPESLFSEVL